MNRTYPYEVVIMTSSQHRQPHAKALRNANPGLAIHVSEPVAGVNDSAYVSAWRNCDRNIRSWWAANRLNVKTPSVIFMEYDVLCNVCLADHIGPLKRGVGAAGAAVMTAVAHSRSFWPFREIPRLPLRLRGHAIAIAPLAFMQIARTALDEILHPEYDDAFDADIFCELRLPTIIEHCGYQIGALELPNVGVRVLHPAPDDRGIFHPVKQPVT